MSAERQTGKPQQMLLDAPDLPVGLEYLWNDFLDLSSSRGNNGWGPSNITFADIDAWQRVNGIRLAAWEIDAIRQVDHAYMADWQSRQRNGD